MSKHPDMMMYQGVDVKLHPFLTSTLDGSVWSVSCISSITQGERVPYDHHKQTTMNNNSHVLFPIFRLGLMKSMSGG
jgi:hypothetical protein